MKENYSYKTTYLSRVYHLPYMVALLLLLLSSCNNRPYNLVDGYIYIQKEGREEMSDNWELVWQDEFNSEQLDTTIWTKIDLWTDVDFGMTKEQWFKDITKWDSIQNINCFSYTTSDPNLYDLKDGVLILDGVVNSDTTADPRPYLQGAIKSKRKFAFKYGRVEIRAKLQAATGSWPAFWMLSENEVYEDLTNRNGEMDIMERLNHDSFVYQTTHSYWTIGMKQKHNPTSHATSSFNPDEFNIFGLEWYPDRLVYSVNGVTSYIYPKLEDADPAQWPFDQPFYMMLDQQLGGGWVGEIDPEDLPAKVVVDWVRLYQ